MIGIYKITSPSKKVYIGQSINIERRLKQYISIRRIEEQVRLYNSIMKYGFEKHKFEILEECEVSHLNDKERYYQDLYSAVGRNGLNCKLTTSSDRVGKHHPDTIKKMIEWQKNRPKTKPETIEKLKMARKNRKPSEESKLKTKLKMLGKQNCLGNKQTEQHKKNISLASMRTILDINTGVFYNGAKELCKLYNIKERRFRSKLNNNEKNDTQFRYC